MASSIRNAQRPSAQISSAEIIGGNNDLAVQILQRLPAKSIIKFKSVSKTWLSLISGHRFSRLWQQHRRRSQDPKISGLFFACMFGAPIKYIPVTDIHDVSNVNYINGGQDNSVARFDNMDQQTTIMDSCNGFLLCNLGKPGYNSQNNYRVYNPTIKQCSTLPWPFSHTNIFADPLYLAFDPLKSPFYKVVLLQKLHKKNKMGNYIYQIHIYSSETHAWRSDHLVSAPVHFHDGVYCNGSIHWISRFSEQDSIYFDVDQERLCPMPSLPFEIPDDACGNFRRFGESRGSLHFTHRNNYNSKFNVDVFEMESNYSKWSFKYRVDFNSMIDFVSQEMNMRDAVSLLTLIHGEDEGDVFLVLFVGINMIISYNIKDNTFKKLHDVANPVGCALLNLKGCTSIYRYIETLFPV